jgi:hypothetical protein
MLAHRAHAGVWRPHLRFDFAHALQAFASICLGIDKWHLTGLDCGCEMLFTTRLSFASHLRIISSLLSSIHSGKAPGSTIYDS